MKKSIMKRVFHSVRLRLFLTLWCLCLGVVVLHPEAIAQSANENMTNEKALALAEKFGIDVGEVDE